MAPTLIGCSGCDLQIQRGLLAFAVANQMESAECQSHLCLHLQIQRGLPGIGEFQCYDKFMLEDLRKAALAIGEDEW